MSWLWELVPRPQNRAGVYSPLWNAVCLFFNFSSDGPPDYRRISQDEALIWLDEGVAPVAPGLSEFVFNYWLTMSYHRFGCGINTPRDSAGRPLIPEIAIPADGPYYLGPLINSCLRANPEEVWRAAGSLIHPENGHRFIPNVILVHRYWGPNIFAYGGWDVHIGDYDYTIGSGTHFAYDLWVDVSDPPFFPSRKFWGTLAHEHSHNFVQYGDLYGPDGCTGYWDILGDNSQPMRMSESSSVHKERIGWLNYLEVIRGPVYEPQVKTLRPYTLTGDAIKVVPDPEHNPTEYFVIEYRKSTGREPWTPDGALTESGLLITHMNSRFGGPVAHAMREAPYFDPEFADFSDRGGALWTGMDRLNGILFHGSRNQFTEYTAPSSNFYGPWPNGLNITAIEITDDEARFVIDIDNHPMIGWTVSAEDRSIAGRFTEQSLTEGNEILIHNAGSLAVLEHRQTHWFVRERFDNSIFTWRIDGTERWIAVDMDGDTRHEVYARRPNGLALFKWETGWFQLVADAHDSIDDWSLAAGEREVAGDVDGDGREEIVLRAADRIGLLKLSVSGRLELRSQQVGNVDSFPLRINQREWTGRFIRPDQSAVLVKSETIIALLVWDSRLSRFTLRAMQSDRSGDWVHRAGDLLNVGDFDGDGLDEIYIRSATRAGLLKWQGDNFTSIWTRDDNIEHRLARDPRTIPLTASNRSYTGRFLPSQDGILHRSPDGLAILLWENNAMKFRRFTGSWLAGRWALSESDELVVADFHRVGLEYAEPAPVSVVDDNLADVFIHNGWGTSMLAFNHPSGDGEEFAMTWMNARELMYRRMSPGPILPPPILYRWEQYIVGNLADGGYLILGPGMPRPVGPWDPTTLKRVLDAYESIRSGMRTIRELGVELPKAKDAFLSTVGEEKLDQPTPLILKSSF